MKRTIGEALKAAIESRDAEQIGRIVESLRLRGLNYPQTYAMAKKLTGIELPEWDALLEEADTNG